MSQRRLADADISIWRDYDRGMVGIQLPGQPRRLIPPAEARDMADGMEQEFADDVLDEGDTRDLIDDLRQFSDDVEG